MKIPCIAQLFQQYFSSLPILKLIITEKYYSGRFATFCLLSELQISGSTSETLGRESCYSAEDMSLDFKTSLQIQTETLGRISRSSSESFRCEAAHLKFGYQTRCSILLMYFYNISFLLLI